MRAIDRLFAILIGLVLLLESVLFLDVSLRLQGSFLQTLLSRLYQGQDWLIALVVFVILGILAAYLFALAFRRRRPYETIQYTTPLGVVRISVQAIEDLAHRAARKVKGVRDAEVTVRQAASGVTIVSQISVSPDVSIPEVTSEIRTRLESYVRETAGVGVEAVDVTVKKIAADIRARVE